MNSNRLLYSVVLLLAVLVASSYAGIIEFDGKSLKSTNVISYRMAMITKDQTHGKNDPYIRFANTWEVEDSSCKSSSQSLHVLLYPAQVRGDIGKVVADGRQYCCSAATENCSKGIYIKKDTKHVKHWVSIIGPNEPIGYVNHSVQVATTSKYIVDYIQCSEDCEYKIKGELIFENPYGFLSAELRHYPVLFGILAGLYISLMIYWIGISFWHRKVLLMVQNSIAVVILLGVIESVAWFLEFLITNIDGHRNWPAVETAILVSTCKRTLSRELVLIVSMGYGIVKYDLGSVRLRISAIGFAYFVASGLQTTVDILSREGETNDILNFLGVVVTFPVILLDTLFYWWIFISLMKTIQQLTARQASVKLELYKQFFTVLVGAAVFTACVMIIEVCERIFLPSETLWTSEWLLTTCWQGLYFAVLTAIAYLWRPTENNTRYAYVESEDAEIMLEEVVPVEGITQRRIKDDSASVVDSTANSINTDNVDVELTLPSFTIDEDDDFLDEASKMQ